MCVCISVGVACCLCVPLFCLPVCLPVCLVCLPVCLSVCLSRVVKHYGSNSSSHQLRRETRQWQPARHLLLRNWLLATPLSPSPDLTVSTLQPHLCLTSTTLSSQSLQYTTRCNSALLSIYLVDTMLYSQ